MSESNVEQLRELLNRSKTDLSKKGPAKDRFIAKVMGHVTAINAATATPAPAPKPQPDSKPAPKRDPNRIIQIKAKNLELGPGGSVQMTGSDSMRADEENGNSPFVGGSNGR